MEAVLMVETLFYFTNCEKQKQLWKTEKKKTFKKCLGFFSLQICCQKYSSEDEINCIQIKIINYYMDFPPDNQ